MNEWISCLCVSRPDRWGQLQRAIADFDRQTHADRELIIVADQKTDYAALIESYIAHDLEHPLKAVIKVFARPMHSQMDGLMYAMCQAQGNMIALWDDDNMNHPDRLTAQVEAQKRFPGAVTAFGQSLYYFHNSNELFVADYADPSATAAERCAVSTLMGPRDIFPTIEPQFRSKPAEMMVNSMSKSGKKLVILNSTDPRTGFLHIVGVGADNQRSYDLHRRLAQERGRKTDWIARHKDALVQALDGYKWGVSEVDVVGTDAAAFKYTPKNLWPDTLFPIKIKDDSVEELTEHLPENG